MPSEDPLDRKLILSIEDSDLTSLDDSDSSDDGIRRPLSQATFSVQGSINSVIAEPIINKGFIFEADHERFTGDSSVTEIINDWTSDQGHVEITLDIESNSPLPDPPIEIDVEALADLPKPSIAEDSPLTSLSSIDDLIDHGVDSITETHEEELNEPIEVDQPPTAPKDNRASNHRPLNLKSALDLDHPNIQDRAGFTQLIRSAKLGDLASCQLLLQANANVNLCDNGGWTALHMACNQRHPEIVKLLIAHGADIHMKHHGGNTPLHEASSVGCVESVAALVEAGANLHARNKFAWSPIDVCENKECRRLLQMGLIDKAPINRPDQLGSTLLHYACLDNDLPTVTRLVNEGADVNVLDRNGTSPLHIACKNGNLEIAHLLYENGALINAIDGGGNTPLHLACQANRLNIVAFLVGENADATKPNSNFLVPHLLTSSEKIRNICKEHIIAHCSDINGFDILLKPGPHETHPTKKVNHVSHLQTRNHHDANENINSSSTHNIKELPLGKTKRNRAKSKPSPIINVSQSSDTNINIPPPTPSSSSKGRDTSRSRGFKRDIKHDTALESTNTDSSTSPRKAHKANHSSFVLESPDASHSFTKVSQSHSKSKRKPRRPFRNYFKDNSTTIPNLTEQEKDLLRTTLGFAPLYSVQIVEHPTIGFLVTDFQVELYLNISEPGTFVQSYPEITKIPMAQRYLDRFWPTFDRMLDDNSTPDLPRRPITREDFYNRPQYFLRLRDIYDIIHCDFPLYALILEFQAFAAYCHDPNGPNTDPILPGDEGFPAGEYILPEKKGSKYASAEPEALDLGYFGTPRYVYRVKEFLKKHPKMNPCPELSLDQAARAFVTRKRF